MGAGRKTHTVLADTAAEPRGAVQLGLKKEDLGGIIFVCNNETMDECLSNKLFGLPRAHLNYVLNVEEGMPLFLFNYDPRELMGIFVATSDGGYNIDPYAWSPSGKTQSRYPAQVRVKLDRECKPVPEKVFSRVIRENYYAPGKFMLELTKTQTREMLRLFTPVKPPFAKEASAAGASSAVPKPAEVAMPKPMGLSPLPNAWKRVEKPAPAPVELTSTPTAPTPAPAPTPGTIPPVNWKEAVSGKAPAAPETPAVEEKKSWFEQIQEEEEEEVKEEEDSKPEVKNYGDNEDEVAVLEQILENLQVGENSKPDAQLEKVVWSSKPAGAYPGDINKVKPEQEDSEWEKLVGGIHESSIGLVVEKNLRLCSEALLEMRESETSLNQSLEELRMKGECLQELDAARLKNLSLIKVSISMAQEINRLKSEVQQLKQQFVKVQ